jgi:SAM-dependent methyltransferase
MTNHNPLTENLGGEDWAGEMGERWLAGLDRFESMISPVGDALLDRAEFRAGERVIDIGCGGGATTREIARRVAPAGRVLGLDISQALVGEARRRAAAEGLDNVDFEAADATHCAPAGMPFDHLFSRFGTMFFADPDAAFRNFGRLVRPGGRLDIAVWAPAKGNPWVAGLMGILRNHIDISPPPPGAPGPFSLDDPERVRHLLEGGGFGDIDVHFWQGRQLLGGAGSDADSAARFMFDSMSWGKLLAQQPAAVQSMVMAEVRELFKAHETSAGVVMGANAWLVRALRR